MNGICYSSQGLSAGGTDSLYYSAAIKGRDGFYYPVTEKSQDEAKITLQTHSQLLGAHPAKKLQER